MFDSSYPFSPRFTKNNKKTNSSSSKSVYAFSTEKERYIIECERYLHNIYVIKFFPVRAKRSSKRFNILTNEYKAGRIVGTCIRVIMQILQKNPEASFGFVGSHTFDPKRQYEEKRSCTKRFKIYRFAVFSLIGEEVFTHFMEERNSTFLLVNNKNSDVLQIKNDADKMFDKIFPLLHEI